MQRDIKFRFFDTLRNCTFTTEDMNSYEVWDCVQDDRFNAMQYTGLKDKNGAEIYEGDIILYTNKANHHTEFSDKYIVEFGEQDLGHSTYQQTIGWNATRDYSYGKESLMDSGRLSNGILSLFGTHRVEVIGNIYENPGLINS